MGKKKELFAAARSHDLPRLLRILSVISKKLSNGDLLSCIDDGGNTPLHFAGLNNLCDEGKALINYGFSSCNANYEGFTPLHLASIVGNREFVTLACTMEKFPSPIDIQDRYGNTALHLAISSNKHDVCEVLLQHECNIFIRNSVHETPLDCAINKDNKGTIKLLLRYCNKDLSKLSDNASTPLHTAARKGNRKILKKLLEVGFSINAKTENGSCLHEAMISKNSEAITYLIKHGIDLSIKNSSGETVMQLIEKYPMEEQLRARSLIIASQVRRQNLNSSA